MDRRGVLCFGLSLGMVAGGWGQAPAVPVRVSRTLGHCSNCEIVRGLENVQFLGSRTVWAVGSYFPAEGEGAGDYSVLRSRDGGEHWVEIPRSRMHATEPSVSFVDVRHGWISMMQWDGESRLLRTVDSGTHWRTVSDHFIRNMQFLNAREGVGAEFGMDRASFVRTSDGGRTWTSTEVPDVRFIDKVVFLTTQVGWVGGMHRPANDPATDYAVVSRTTDGGRSWESVRIPAPLGVADIRDLYFRNALDGWLITWHFNNDGTHLFRTTDGGKSWTMEPDPSIQGPGRWLAVVRFVSAEVGVGFGWTGTVEPLAGVGVEANRAGDAGDSGRMLWTSDGGAHWRSRRFDSRVYDCQVLAGGLGCSAAGAKGGFLTLKVEPGKGR